MNKESLILLFFGALAMFSSCGRSDVSPVHVDSTNQVTPPNTSVKDPIPTPIPAPDPSELRAKLVVSVNPNAYSSAKCPLIAGNACKFHVTYNNQGNYPADGIEVICDLNPWGVFDSAMSSGYSRTLAPGETKTFVCTYSMSYHPGPDRDMGSIVIKYNDGSEKRARVSHPL